MAFFSLYELMDKDKKYKKEVHEILKKRIANLYENLKLPLPESKDNTYYYALLDLAEVAKIKYDDSFKQYLISNVDILDFLFKLAREKFVVCLPGDGFAGPKWSLRVSLANLELKDYIVIGKALTDVLHEYYEEYKKKN